MFIAATVVALTLALSACGGQSGVKWPDQNMPDRGSLPVGLKKTAFGKDLNSWLESQGYPALDFTETDRLFYEDDYCSVASGMGSETTSEQKMQRVADVAGKSLGKDYDNKDDRAYIDTLAAGLMTYAVKYNCPTSNGDVLKLIEGTGGQIQKVEMRQSPVPLPSIAPNADQQFDDEFRSRLYNQGLRLASQEDVSLLRDSGKTACAILRHGFGLDIAVMETKSAVQIYLNYRRTSYSDTQSELSAFVHETVATGITHFCPEYIDQIKNINIR